MKKIILLFSLVTFLTSCNSEKQEADLLVINAKVYTVDSTFSTVEAFAVKDGKFLRNRYISRFKR